MEVKQSFQSPNSHLSIPPAYVPAAPTPHRWNSFLPIHSSQVSGMPFLPSYLEKSHLHSRCSLNVPCEGFLKCRYSAVLTYIFVDPSIVMLNCIMVTFVCISAHDSLTTWLVPWGKEWFVYFLHIKRLGKYQHLGDGKQLLLNWLIPVWFCFLNDA